MPHQLTREQRAQAIILLDEKFSSRAVAKRIGSVHHSTILRLKKKHEETGNIENRPGAGRPRKLTERDERNCIRRLMTNEYSTAVGLQKSLNILDNIEVCANTIRRALRRNGLVARVKRKKPLLTKVHRQKRLAFAKKYQSWTVDDWNRVVWSDESKFQIYGSDGRSYCWKRPAESLHDRHVKPTKKFGGGSVFVWGCFTCFGTGYMCKIDGGLNAELYRQILSEDFLETLELYKLNYRDIIFQQDNDPKHTAKDTKKWFDDRNIQVLLWSTQSPDLTSLE